MNSIDLDVEKVTKEEVCYKVIIDKKEVFNMFVKVKYDVATVSYDGNSKYFKGFSGALLIHELLNYVLVKYDNVALVKSYFDFKDVRLEKYSDDFKFEIKEENDKICCFTRR